jgi:hypothetical protein
MESDNRLQQAHFTTMLHLKKNTTSLEVFLFITLINQVIRLFLQKAQR